MSCFGKWPKSYLKSSSKPTKALAISMNISNDSIVDTLIKESNGLIAIVVSSIKTVKKNL